MQGLTIWLNNVVKIFLGGFAFLISTDILAQKFTLEEVIAAATAHYPLLKEKQYIHQTATYAVQNLDKAFLPQIQINAQASYQSDVTSLPVALPGIKMEPPGKDQYRMYADISQVIYDGGLVQHQKSIQEKNAYIEEQKVEAALTTLRDRITKIYMGILLAERQVKQVNLLKDDLEAAIKIVSAQVQQGSVLRTQLYVLEAELLKTEQRRTEIGAAKKALMETLGLYMNQSIPADAEFMVPSAPAISIHTIQRPELNVYNGQKQVLQEQKKIITSRYMPKTSAFVQAGYSRPGLNMLKNSFEPYYIAGIKINWSLGYLYTARNEKKILENNHRSVDVQKEMFLLQTSIQQKELLEEIKKWEQFILADTAIIARRVQVTKVTRAQLENGTITGSDYLREVNAENAARQSLILHELQLILARISYINISGNHYNTLNK